MRFKKTKQRSEYSDESLWEPIIEGVNETVMFQHCCNGEVVRSMTYSYLNFSVLPLLKAHGAEYSIDD